MILSKSVKIEYKRILSRKEYYISRGYDISSNIIEIYVKDLPLGSNITIMVKCDYCDFEKEISYKSYNISCKKFNKYSCSSKCSREKVKLTNLEKYGVENVFQSETIKDKIKETNIEKYGVENVFQSETIKDKIKETNMEKYGFNSYTKTNDYLESYKKTNLERYGVDNFSKTNEYRIKVKNTSLERYGVDSYTKTNEYKIKSKETHLKKYKINNYKKSEVHHKNTIIGSDINYIKYLDNNISLFNCNKGHTFEISSDSYHYRIKNNTPLCTVCNPIGDSKSIKEKELLDFIQNNYKGDVISGYRDGLEIDIFLPELKLGFEFNGLYWHSEEYRDKNYHINKTYHFSERGIRIIHIWSDDYDNRLDIVKSQILNLLGESQKIFARKCVIKEVSVKEARKFLDENHIQGFTSSSFKVGLYYTVTQSNGVTNEELVSIMTFDSFEGRKKMEEGGYNLSRFCNKLGYNVIGGASKLLNHFIKTYKATRIVSYADKDWSIGSLYHTLGFENVGGNGPDYKYIVNNKRVHKSRYKKSRLNTNLTESQATKNLGINRIYDCGKIKFEKVIYR